MSRQLKDEAKKNKKKNHFQLGLDLMKLEKHQILRLVIYSVLMVFALEMLSRRSVMKGLGFIMANPLMFGCNVLIVLLTLSISMMFSKRNFMLILISVIWLGLGVTNFIILCFRSTPLTAMDFYLLKSVSGIIHVYVDSIKMILISVALTAILAAMFLLWRKVKRYQIQIRIPLLIIGLSSVSMLLLSTFALKVSALSDDFGNLPDAYADYGFAYCFSNSVIERGIKQPDNYSQEQVDQVLNEIDNGSDKLYTNNETTTQQTDQSGQIQSFNINETENTQVKPNIIMVQLESFFDVNNLLDYSFSENPVPNYTKLKENYSSGYLTVPAYGAGTVNTEFEILSGMNLEFFGTGEYPYRTILQSTTTESICYNLAELGYHSYAIHNNTATFYNRDKILPMLGFDNFSSLEYMNNIEYNPTGWARDNVLTDQILSALNADATQDFVYTITVQSHGKYQDTITEDDRIKVSADPEKRKSLGIVSDTGSETDGSLNINTDEAYMNELEYYVNELSQTDQFVGELTKALSEFKEPTIVVFFGDHLPPLNFQKDDLINGNTFQTEYVMWSNYPMENKKLDLAAYQLSPYVMERVGYDNGLLTKFHQRCVDNPDYQDDLKLLQYDMLYGKQYVYNGTNPYVAPQMKMGIKDVKITDVALRGDSIYVYGENFTPWSVVNINDKSKETTFIDENTLSIPYEDLTDANITVAQVTDSNKILSQSAVYTK
ncbi:MAG TPA: sulfatase-like hydrolase/transferase [Mobilitalea sp.]|nr:sulfatase-like hydrolase/transferase [Mobilitalea sp.]